MKGWYQEYQELLVEFEAARESRHFWYNRAKSAETRVKELQNLCAEVYQWAGAYDAPTKVLDNLSDAASGDTLKHDTLLPALEPDNLRRALNAEAREADLREALEKIADEEKVYKGHGDFDVLPAVTHERAQAIARKALSNPSPRAEKVQRVLEQSEYEAQEHTDSIGANGEPVGIECGCDFCQAVRELKEARR